MRTLEQHKSFVVDNSSFIEATKDKNARDTIMCPYCSYAELFVDHPDGSSHKTHLVDIYAKHMETTHPEKIKPE